MAGPKDKRKKYSKDQSKITEKYKKKAKKLDSMIGEQKEGQQTRNALKQVAGILGSAGLTIPMLTEKGIRAAKKKITGKAKGGMVIAPKSGSAHYTSKKNSKSIAKKYFKGSF